MSHAMSATNERRYLLGLGLGILAPLLVVVAVNFVADPFRVFHASWFDATYPRDPRRLVPGLIRTTEYDAVLAGTSHCDNFLPSSVERTLGWRALRITLPGSTFPEQRLAVETAIETGRVRHVLWGLDLFAFYSGDDTEISASFPTELYRPSWRRPANYLLSLDTTRESLRVLAGRGDRDLETRGAWHAKFEFSEAAALRNAVGQLAAAERQAAAAQRHGWAAVERHVAESLEPLVRRHPEVEFRFVLPPISALGYLADEFATGPGLAERLRFRELLCRRLSELPNVRLHDFETATEITHDLSRYMDLTHFGLPVNEWMLEQMAADSHRLTPATLADHQARFGTATTQFLAAVRSADHPWKSQLRLDRFRFRPVGDALIAGEPGLAAH
jgi:hypothetical protein